MGASEYHRQVTISNDYSIEVVFEEKPNTPTKDDLLAQDIPVVVECTNSEVAHTAATYNLSDFNNVVVTDPVKNDDGTYTFTVSNSVFVDKYNEDNSYTGENKHETDDSGTAQVTLSYTEKDGKGNWTVAPGTSITFKVKCGASDTPTLPDDEEIPGILSGRPVLVKCVYDGEDCAHEQYRDEEYALMDNTYEVYGLAYNEQTAVWTCTVEIKSNDYVKVFIGATGVIHVLAGPNTRNVTLTWDRDTGLWKAPADDEYAATFEVTCDPETTGNLYQITDFTKEIVTSAPTGITVPDNITYPVNNKVTAETGDQITLLYKLTVTGDPGAAYQITDEGAEVVSGYSLTGVVGENGTAVVYVTKSFTIAGTDTKLTNSASVTANGPDTEVTDPDDGKDEQPPIPDEGTGDNEQDKPDNENGGQTEDKDKGNTPTLAILFVLLGVLAACGIAVVIAKKRKNKTEQK